MNPFEQMPNPADNDNESTEEKLEENLEQSPEFNVEQLAAEKVAEINAKFELSGDSAITTEELIAQYQSHYEIGDGEGGNSLTHKHENNEDVVDAVMVAGANLALEKLQSEKTGDSEKDKEVEDKISNLLAKYGEQLDYSRILK